MATRRILVIDNDSSFATELKAQLSAYDLELQHVMESDKPLDIIPDFDPDLILIAVDMPQKMGYALCNRVKKSAAPDTPVILTTSTLPEDGFAQHSRLKHSADHYIDKRLATVAECVEAIGTLIDLGEASAQEFFLDETQIEEDEDFSDLTSASDFAGDSTQMTDASDFLNAQGVQDDAESAFGELEAGPPPAPGPPKIQDVPPMQDPEPEPDIDSAAYESAQAENAQLKAQIDELKEQLSAAAATEASAAPLSQDREVLKLRAVINEHKKEMLDLQDRMTVKDREVLEATETIRNLERTKSDSDSQLLERDQAILSGKEGLAALNATLAALTSEHESVLSAKERELKELADSAAADAEEQRAEQDKVIESLRLELDDALEEQRLTLQTKYEDETRKLAEAHAEELARQLESARSEADARQALALTQAGQAADDEADALRAEHTQTLEAAEQAKETALQNLKDLQTGQLARLEREATSEREAQEQAHQEAQAALTADFQAKLDEAENALKLADADFAQHEQTILAEHEAALGKVQSELSAQAEELMHDRARLGEVQQALADAHTTIEEQNNRNAATESRLAEARSELDESDDAVTRAKKAMAIALTVLDQLEPNKVGTLPVGTQPDEGDEERIQVS